MNKKITALLMASAMIISVAACSEDDSSDETTAAAGETAEETTEALETEAPSDTELTTSEAEESTEDIPRVPEIEVSDETNAQLQIMADNYDKWHSDNEYEDYYYAVTDMDDDGNYELIAASTQGSGMYTYARIFEVDPASGELNELETNVREGYDFPDMIADSVETVTVDGITYYVGYNTASSGMNETSLAMTYMSIQDNVFMCEDICSSYESYDEDMNQNAVYYDGDGNEISVDEYNELFESIYNTGDFAIKSLGWVEVSDDSDLVSLLASSLQAFAEPALVPVG